ncbi:MAG: phosphomannomutase, partial [Desulfovibrio sp.]|nr:phosphomannomutase [Desulfovibrio sp.]
LTILADAGNGSAGGILEALSQRLPFDIIPFRWEPDGSFPHGIPNPLLPEKRAATSAAVRKTRADLGIAFDGDCDRCFFYDGEGTFVEGAYCVGLLASELLRRHPGEKIIHDPRVYWNTQDMVLSAKGIPLMGKTGHAFMKERMRAENALYGGEMSAHHYFRDFAFCDSGMLPWLVIAAMLSLTGKPLAEYLFERKKAFPCSGEINRKVSDTMALFENVHARYAKEALHEDFVDGLNLEFSNWRFNVRKSNTEALVRLNVESRGDEALLKEKTDELLRLIDEG